ncbi:hypothetical protein XOC_2753 [Xanthomonas oryzae pv. oryzicola BLS256]|uniref:Uncharacterized protein n=1 Tax=Xanthomonas oryzae pv. oryzicola (strain BLS256) TaxID=383407 RepID=G7TIF0_XANOB|nr:hypothetical protein XOC_2753 [Xanthomonas oryzae pv. oryzicola BLS256]
MQAQAHRHPKKGNRAILARCGGMTNRLRTTATGWAAFSPGSRKLHTLACCLAAPSCY